jgi:hypothetical protein
MYPVFGHPYGNLASPPRRLGHGTYHKLPPDHLARLRWPSVSLIAPPVRLSRPSHTFIPCDPPGISDLSPALQAGCALQKQYDSCLWGKVLLETHVASAVELDLGSFSPHRVGESAQFFVSFFPGPIDCHMQINKWEKRGMNKLQVSTMVFLLR